ncbi:hypothetical protein RSOLAG22IIIB_10512 [Rhizoctonia solani]|uniref:Laminin domain protein n=1 Tax=Rhizoctonia solani TaxID=456999 RepID=A0A0K6G495_9AGAM|nr:hypothetical protein RSOLAG22IIIB_10512 [Rhizoctonia solani]
MMAFNPPQLPAYLSDTCTLDQIIGTPKNEEMKAIHAAIRGLNSVAHLPSLYNADLSMQLSQHLFDAQMAVYRANYSIQPLATSSASIYVPPALPPDIPGTLDQVVGAPTDAQIQSVQRVVRFVENLLRNPQRFDVDLSMQLSQHLFDLQLARHMHNAKKEYYNSNESVNEYISDVPEPNAPYGLTRLESVLQDINKTAKRSEQVLEKMNQALHSDRGTKIDGGTAPESNTGIHASLARMEQIMIEMQKTMIESKDVLENVNRVLISNQRVQSTVGSLKSTVHMNPVNQQGRPASECGLPMLRYWLSGTDYVLWMDAPAVAKYLKFFGIGAHLTRSGDNPTLIDGKADEAAKLLFTYIGLYYESSQYYYAQTT